MGNSTVAAHRFLVLDGLRGVAALAVLTVHLTQQHVLHPRPAGALAVDFFYVLSGFVVAFAYEKRLQSGDMGLRQFGWIRFLRLYPLLFVGIMGGVGLAFLAAVLKHDVALIDVAKAAALALVLAPSFVFPQWGTAFPFNMAQWTLTFEAFVNLVYALIVRFLTTPRLIALLVLSCPILVWVALENNGVAGGNDQDNFWWGFGRVMFPFFAGVLLYRLRPRQRPNAAAAWALLTGLALLLLVPQAIGQWPSLAYVLVVFPFIVAAGAAVNVEGRLAAACSWLGAMSYPVYILQGPVLRVGAEVLKHAPVSGLSAWGFGAIEAAVVMGVAWLGWKADAWLQERFRSRRGGPLRATGPRWRLDQESSGRSTR